MSDAEWESWQSTWQGTTGPLPEVHARARALAWRHRFDNIAGGAMILAGFGISAYLLASGRRHETIIGSADLVFTVAILVGFVLIQRGVRVDRIGNPRDALAFLERRLRAERLGAQLCRATFLSLYAVAAWFSHGAIDEAGGVLQIVMAVVSICAVSFLLALPFLVGRRTRREQAELDRWRAWMDEQQV